jgi:hypothetical protein
VYGLDDRSSIPRRGSDGIFCLRHRVRSRSGAHPASYPMGTGEELSSPRVKWLGLEADQSSPSSAEVKNAWSYTSSPFVHVHGVMLTELQGHPYLQALQSHAPNVRHDSRATGCIHTFCMQLS